MASSLNRMIETFQDAAERANAIAQGSFEAEIAPRSAKDELGTALLLMTTKIREAQEDAELQRIEQARLKGPAWGSLCRER